MCRFLSSIGFSNGDIICHPNIDSHEDLVKIYDLKESKMRNWVRLEYYPDSNNYHKLDDYSLKIDDDIAQWIDDNVKSKWESKLKLKMKSLIVTENKYMLQGNTYILSNGICVEKVMHCRIFQMLENSQVNNMLENSQVNNMLENSQVNNMWENSQVNKKNN